MFRKQLLCLLLALVCGVTALAVTAAEVDCDSTYCFSQEDFSEGDLKGICITGLPDPARGTVMLGTRVLRSGDILTAQQISQMTFVPTRTEEDQEAIVTFLPIYEDRVEKAAAMTISIRGKVDQAPVAEDQAMETYKNLANSAPLKAKDPEGKALTYTVTRQPKRGSVEIDQNGAFTYTPKKNKVGTDSFTYTVTDPQGNVSREATVTIRILKPGDSARYADTGLFEAEWLKNTGLFVGEQVGGQLVFHGEKTVSRGEFLTMAIQVLGIPVDESLTTSAYEDQIPTWLQPYVAAALRSGMTAGLSSTTFGAEEPMDAMEAAVMLQNAMDLAVSAGTMDTAGQDVPDWAVGAVAAMSENGIAISAGNLSRFDAAKLLYQISKLVDNAPGLKMYR